MLNIVVIDSLTVVPKYNRQTGSYADILLIKWRFLLLSSPTHPVLMVRGVFLFVAGFFMDKNKRRLNGSR